LKNFIFFSTLIISCLALAQGHEVSHGGGEHEAIEIPLREIGWQSVNLGILLIALFFIVKESIKKFFINRRQNFVAQAEKTKSFLLAAESALSDVKQKLQVLESGEKVSIEKANQEAAALKTSLIKDAEAQAQKMKDDTKLVVSAELEKAKAEISAVIVGGAVAATSQKISSKKDQITKESESEFLRQIGQVKA
jgi:F-type H+-transporting ATPase subunit b